MIKSFGNFAGRRFLLLLMLSLLLLPTACKGKPREELLIELQMQFKQLVKHDFLKKNEKAYMVISTYQESHDVSFPEEGSHKILRREKGCQPESDRYDLYYYSEGTDFTFTSENDPWKPLEAKIHHLRQHWTFDPVSNWYRCDTEFDTEELWSFYRGELKKTKTLRQEARKPWEREIEMTTYPVFEKKIRDLDYGVTKETPSQPKEQEAEKK